MCGFYSQFFLLKTAKDFNITHIETKDYYFEL